MTPNPQRAPELNELVERLSGANRSPHTVRAYQRYWRQLLTWCRVKKADHLGLTEMEAKDCYGYLTNGFKPPSRLQFLAAVRYAYKEWGKPNPFSTVTPPKHDISHTPPRYLTAEQVPVLMEVLNAEKEKSYVAGLTFHLAAFLFYTATRYAEATELDWGHLIRRAGTPIAARIKGKGGSFAELPLNKRLGQYLLSWEEFQKRTKKIRVQNARSTSVTCVAFSRSTYIFPGRDGTPFPNHSFNRCLKAACKAAGLEPITAHSLRHTAATLSLEDGRDIREVQEILRHKNVATTARYLHIDHNKKRQLYEGLENKF